MHALCATRRVLLGTEGCLVRDEACLARTFVSRSPARGEPCATIAKPCSPPRRGQKTRDRQFIAAIRAAIIGLLGDENPELVTFGFKPRKKRSATVEEKTLAVARGKETRQKRGTVGPRAKAAIKGDQLNQVTVTAEGGIQVPPPKP
jgi:hypothetical protein